MKDVQVKNPIVEVNFDEAKVLADLGAIVQELDSIMKMCLRLKKLLEEESKDSLLIESLWTTALIKYARCFNTGKRFGLDESILNGLKGEAHKAHKFYLDMRDKHIAHSVNPFEQTQVSLVLSPKDSHEKKVVGVAILSIRHMVSDVQGVHQLGLLSKVLLEKVCKIAKQYENKTLEKGKTIPIDDLYKRARPRITAPGPEESDKPRL